MTCGLPDGSKLSFSRMFNVDPINKFMGEASITVSGGFEELVQDCDIMLDSSPGGVGEKKKEL